MKYGPGPQIPTAALSVEDAELVARLAARGPVTLHLVLEDGPRPDAPSFNVLAELRGRERPEEIVVIGAHIDSWDIGQGAQDDGAGVAIVMESLATLRRLGLVPRRTIRAVLYTSEETGAQGGKTYAAAHAEELAHHVAAFETDIGAGTPLGFRIDAAPAAVAELRGLVALLAPLGATNDRHRVLGLRHHAMRPAGVPLLGLFSDPTHYFDVHHSVADTLEKIDPPTLGRNVAAMATMAYVVADRPTRWPVSPPPRPSTSREPHDPAAPTRRCARAGGLAPGRARLDAGPGDGADGDRPQLGRLQRRPPVHRRGLHVAPGRAAAGRAVPHPLDHAHLRPDVPLSGRHQPGVHRVAPGGERRSARRQSIVTSWCAAW